jgi:hypothetical protein
MVQTEARHNHNQPAANVVDSVGVDSQQPSECLLPGVHTAPQTWILGTPRPQGVMLVESRGRREAPSLPLPPSCAGLPN